MLENWLILQTRKMLEIKCKDCLKRDFLISINIVHTLYIILHVRKVEDTNG